VLLIANACSIKGDVKNIFLPPPDAQVYFATSSPSHHRRRSAEIVTSLAIYSCTGMRDAQREPLLKAAMMSGGLTKMKSVRCDAHERTDECVVHGSDVCLSSAPTT
jgi:hypothetical protein